MLKISSCLLYHLCLRLCSSFHDMRGSEMWRAAVCGVPVILENIYFANVHRHGITRAAIERWILADVKRTILQAGKRCSYFSSSAVARSHSHLISRYSVFFSGDFSFPHRRRDPKISSDFLIDPRSWIFHILPRFPQKWAKSRKVRFCFISNFSFGPLGQNFLPDFLKNRF